MEHIYNCRPQEGWNHIYTDCSAEYALRNYGVGVYMQYLRGSEDKTSLATMCSTNFKIEAKALRTEAAHAEHSTNTPKQCHQKTKQLKGLPSTLTLWRANTVILQWILSHSNRVSTEPTDTGTGRHQKIVGGQVNNLQRSQGHDHGKAAASGCSSIQPTTNLTATDKIRAGDCLHVPTAWTTTSLLFAFSCTSMLNSSWKVQSVYSILNFVNFMNWATLLNRFLY